MSTTLSAAQRSYDSRLPDEDRDDTIYAVLPGQETPEEPQAGWYWGEDDGEIRGPFASKQAAENAIWEARA